MTLLPRPAKLAIFLAVLVTLVALPVVWTQQTPWHGIAPALSHAGGSPDETLNPSSTPTGKCAAVPRLTSTEERPAHRAMFDARSMSRVRPESPAWLLYGRLYLTALLRF